MNQVMCYLSIFKQGYYDKFAPTEKSTSLQSDIKGFLENE